MGVTEEDFDKFEKIWYKFDILRTNFLHISLLPNLIQHLPLRFRRFPIADDSPERTELPSRRILANLHTPVLENDFVVMGFVWISLLYLHVPDHDEVSLEECLCKAYLAFEKRSGLSLKYLPHSDELFFVDQIICTSMMQVVMRKKMGGEPPRRALEYITGSPDLDFLETPGSAALVDTPRERHMRDVEKRTVKAKEQEGRVKGESLYSRLSHILVSRERRMHLAIVEEVNDHVQRIPPREYDSIAANPRLGWAFVFARATAFAMRSREVQNRTAPRGTEKMEEENGAPSSSRDIVESGKKNAEAKNAQADEVNESNFID